MNRFIRNLCVFILIMIFLLGFCSSYASLNIDRLSYVIAIGIDTSPQNKMKVSFQFSATSPASESGTSSKTPTLINTVTASSLSNAINLMNSYMSKELNLSHCKVIIFSEDFAKEGISDEIYTLANDTQIRPSANILVSKCTAKSYLEKTEAELSNLISKYYETLTDSSKSTGYVSDSTIGDFYNALLCNTCQPYAILAGISSEDSGSTNMQNSQKDSDIEAGSSPIEGENQSENIGVVVFKDDTLVGELNALETISLLTIRNDVNRFLISIPDPLNENNDLDIYLTHTFSNDIKVYTDTPSAYIKLKIELSGRIYSMANNANYLSPEVLETISNSCNSYLESTFSSYLYKTSKDFKSDINGFGKSALKNFISVQDFEQYNWLDNYQNAFFDVEVDTSIKSGMLITET